MGVIPRRKPFYGSTLYEVRYTIAGLKKTMPRCKYCHEQISKFDNDVCPHCGEKNPIDDNYRTMDVTGYVDRQSGDYKLYKSKKRQTAGLLCCFLGIFGVDAFYLGFTQKAVIRLCVDLLLYAGVSLLLLFAVKWNAALSFLLPFGVEFLAYLFYSLFYWKGEDLKDARGEFLR